LSSLFEYDAGSALSRFGGSRRSYPDPFRTYTTMLMPRNISEKLRWCEGMWVRNGTYSRAMKRVISYFITYVDIATTSDDDKKKYEEYLNETLNVLSLLSQVGEDMMAYGNSFTSIYIPFHRFLACPQCHSDTRLSELDFKFENAKFKWKCPKCHKEVTTDKPVDRKIKDETKLKIKRWSPHEIRIIEHPISGDKVYLWDCPKNILNQIYGPNQKFTLEYLPWEMIEAILANKMFEFAPRVIFHLSEPTLAGIHTGGWGISQTLMNFGQAYYVQMAKMYNEVLMNEYIVPFRVIYPERAAGVSGDPLQTLNVNSYNSQLLSMLKAHRTNPGGYYAAPFPVGYKALSGEGMQLTTHEHINAAIDEMLNAAGVPAELYKGTVQFQALPTALRLFQQTWVQFSAQLNSWLNWLIDSISTAYNWGKVKAKLRPVTLADDIEKRSILLQLMAGNRVSAETALAPLGINATEELSKLIHEQKEQMELQQRFQEEMDQKVQLQQAAQGAAQGGGQAAPAGQDPAQMQATPQPTPGAVPPGATPEDLMAQADSEAQRLLSMPYELRRKDMNAIKNANPTLHALVKAKLEQYRSDARSQGGAALIQQQMGQQTAMG